MPITKTIEECYERWELVESGEITQSNPLRADQCHKPLLTQSGCLFAILHQALRLLDFVLKILYHLVAGHKVWSEADPTVKAGVAASKAKMISHVKATCGGLLVDSPTTVGGNTNTGQFLNASLLDVTEKQSAVSSMMQLIEKILTFSSVNLSFSFVFR